MPESSDDLSGRSAQAEAFRRRVQEAAPEIGYFALDEQREEVRLILGGEFTIEDLRLLLKEAEQIQAERSGGMPPLPGPDRYKA